MQGENHCVICWLSSCFYTGIFDIPIPFHLTLSIMIFYIQEWPCVQRSCSELFFLFNLNQLNIAHKMLILRKNGITLTRMIEFLLSLVSSCCACCWLFYTLNKLFFPLFLVSFLLIARLYLFFLLIFSFFFLCFFLNFIFVNIVSLSSLIILLESPLGCSVGKWNRIPACSWRRCWTHRLSMSASNCN